MSHRSVWARYWANGLLARHIYIYTGISVIYIYIGMSVIYIYIDMSVIYIYIYIGISVV